MRGSQHDARRIVGAIFPDLALGRARSSQGEFHDVVLVPGEAAIRIARRAGTAAELERTAELLRRLGDLSLPLLVPQPLAPVQELDGRAVLATTWVPGEPSPRGSGDPVQLRRVLDLLAEVDLGLLDDVLAPPHAYAGGEAWETVMLEDVVPLLPPRWREEARRRIEAALALPAVPPRLVHGDLAGDNMRWDDEGRLVGVLDWDLASAWDPAVDAACLSWHGWDCVEQAVDRDTYRRARIWGATFGIEQVAAALVRDASTDDVRRSTERAVAWLERTASTWD
ncbi:MAG: aminoglycoside phosphotransferase family protein [Actinobacteria bacterium]|nr:aminoglycoside phosphotransferase family protein [Actinomycetota bacterium]